MRLLHIKDEYSFVLKWKVRNEAFVCQLALAQLLVTAVSLAQHVYSVAAFGEIFLCSFNETRQRAVGGDFSPFLSYDVIIFDFGLFHELIHVQECIANYLDGGYMRCLWCVSQLVAIVSLLAVPFISTPRPVYLWPMLLVHNSYCFGLTILTIATADKLLLALVRPVDTHAALLVAVFLVGSATNHFLDYVLWHFYWHVEAEHVALRGPVWL